MRVFIDTTTSHGTLPSCPFFLRVKVPTQPSLPASFLFKVPVGELGGLPDAMFVCQNDSVWNNSCFYWLMWSGPIVIIVILETQWAQAYHFLRTNPIICGKFAKKREELPLFDLVNSTTSFLLWKKKEIYCDFFPIRRVSRRKMNDNFFTEALFDLGGVRLSFVWISNPFVSDRVLKINPCPYRFLLLCLLLSSLLSHF